VICEAKRVLKKNGYLLIREHNGIKKIHPIIDFEHLLYEKIVPEEYIGNYKSYIEWEKLIKMKSIGYTNPYGPTETYMQAFKK
jgi:ubiquinone/menaquinone biosynthesis C-methylase UbiE